MLDKYLEIQAHEQEKVASRDHFVERMMLLPNEELFEVQRTGEIKLAYYSDLISDSPDRKTWLDHFKGTPLYARAIALEEEDLKAQAADDQSRMVEDQERMQKNQARDALRLEKRLLELELVKSEQAAESAAMPPPEPSPGMGAPPMGAQGAGAPGGDAEIGKMAAVLKGAAAKAKKEHMDEGPGLPHRAGEAAGRHLPSAGAIAGALFGAPMAHQHAVQSGLGRGGRLASAGLGALLGSSVGHSGGRFAQGVAHGAAHSKDKEAGVGDFLRAAAPAVGDFVKKHPGAAIGGGLGALHGLMRQDGGVGSAVLEGAGGAALGHGVEHMYRSGALKGIKDAVMPPTGGVAKEAAALPPFGGEKNAGHSPEKVFKALRGASAKRVENFGRSASERYGFHDSLSRFADHKSDAFKHHVSKKMDADFHGHMARHELGRKEGLSSGRVQGAAGGAAATGAAYLAGKHNKEKKAFIGAMLGALGGAAARGGASGLMSGGLKGLGGAAMNWAKSNPMKAVGGAMNAASNFASARQQGQGLGGAALSGLAGGASALG
jgi:hypothetical protein